MWDDTHDVNIAESDLEIVETDSSDSPSPSSSPTVNHVDKEEEEPAPISNHVESNNNIDAEEHKLVDNGLPPNGKISSKKQAVIREHNNKLRENAIREVKRPGKSEYWENLILRA